MDLSFDKADLPKFRGIKSVLGPGVVWLALAQGSGELIWWPYFVAKYGTAVLSLLLPSALLQLPLTYHIGKYSMLTGESIWRGFARLSKKFVIVLWLLMNVSFFWFGSFVVAGGTALSELISFGLSKKAESTLWGYVLILTMFLILLRARKTYRVVEKLMWFVSGGTFAGLFVSCLHPDVLKNFREFLKGFSKLELSVVEPSDYEELITAITFMGLGGFWALFYSYWVLEKGFGMASENRNRELGLIPSEGTNANRWKIALFVDSLIGIVGNIVTTIMTCFLAFSILYPRSLFPTEYKIAVVQAEFFRGWFGGVGVKIFLFSSAMFLIDTWIVTADAVSKTNVDVMKIFFPRIDSQKFYKIFLTAITIITFITLPVAPPGELIVLSAMIGFLGMVIFSFAILYIHIKLGMVLPKPAGPKAVETIPFVLTGIAYFLLLCAYIWSKFAVRS